MSNDANKVQEVQDSSATALAKLTSDITRWILRSFLLILLILLIMAIYSFLKLGDGDGTNQWISLFKDGFLLLSGVLTTLVGYYFGNRGSDIALKQAEKVKQANEQILANLDTMSPTNEDQNAGIEDINPNS